VIYRADVELSNVLEIPFGTWVPSPDITARVDELAASGFQWVTFYEGVFEGTVINQYVYLGELPIDVSLEQ
jgi:hypothetical protein